MLKYFFILFAFIVAAVVALAGFRGHFFKSPPIELFPDMDRQPKVKAQKPSDFYANGAGTRLPVEGTVPLGYAMPEHKEVDGSCGEMQGPYRQIRFSAAPDYFNTGKMGDQWGDGLPFEITPEIMARGQERFGIYCAVCHGATGEGNGITSKYGIVGIANLHQERLLKMADGEIFNTITHGKNTMSAYGYKVQVPDRWAILAYIRALQRSQQGTVADVPASERTKLGVQ